MTSQLTAGSVRRRAIEDCAVANRQLFDSQFQQLEPGTMDSVVDYLAGEDTVLYRATFDRRVHIQARLLGARFGVSIPLRNHGVVYDGHKLSKGQLPSTISGEPIEMFAGAGHSHIVLLVSHARLLQAAENANLTDDRIRSLTRGRNNFVLQATPGVIRHLTAKFGTLLDAARSGKPPLPARDFEQMALGAVLSLADGSGNPAKLTSSGARVLFRRVIEAYDAHPEPPNITLLCEKVRASPRTVTAAFQKVAAMGPHQFFLIRRLNRARLDLLGADPRTARVTDIASALGFTELGRFAVRYRQLFGEPPSATLGRHFAPFPPIGGSAQSSRSC